MPRKTEMIIAVTPTAIELRPPVISGQADRGRVGRYRADVPRSALWLMAVKLSCCRFDGQPVKLIPACARTQQG